MARLALVDFAASAVATVQRNESGWPGAFRATCSNMQPPVPGGLAVWRDFGRGKADQDRPKGRTIVCRSSFEQNCSNFERAPEHRAKNLSVLVLVVVVVVPRAMLLYGVLRLLK
jgi:hypothetical protein